MEDFTRSEVVTKYQNGDSRDSDVEDVVISAFDSLNEIHNDDSDDDQQVTVTKTITTYSHNSNDISSTSSEQPEIPELRNHSEETNVTDADWRISRVVDRNSGNYLGDSFESDVHDQQVSDFFTTSPTEDSDQRLTMRADEDVRHPYGGGLAVAPNPNRLSDVPESDTSFHNDENEIHSDDGGYSPPPPIHSDLTHNDVLITSEVRNPDDVNDNISDVDNEFEVPEVPQTNVDSISDNTPSEPAEQSNSDADHDGGVIDTVKEKVSDYRNQGLDYAGDAVNDKLNSVSDEGLIGKAKSQVVEHNVPEVAKEKLTEVSDSVINDDKLADNVKDKITSSGVLGSFGFKSDNETAQKDDFPQKDDSSQNNVTEIIKSEKSEHVESEPPVLEIDTANALAEDDMDYEMQEVDISQSNDEDFGKVFADHRQSMREGTASPLFKQDAASRFNSTGTLNKSDSKKVIKADSEKNGSNYTVNSMPTDEERPKKGCSSILKSFFCPKRGSWQPDSCY